MSNERLVSWREVLSLLSYFITKEVIYMSYRKGDKYIFIKKGEFNVSLMKGKDVLSKNTIKDSNK